MDNSISEDIILLYKTKYYDFNFSHFKEFLKKDENIDVSYDFIYKNLTKAGILSPKARKKTKKEFKKKQLSRNKRFSKEFDEVIEVKEKKKYIPPMTHSWKLSSFLKQIEKNHNQHQYAWVWFSRLLDTKNINWISYIITNKNENIFPLMFKNFKTFSWIVDINFTIF